MTGRQQFRWFRQDQCRLCGQCLMACPVLELDEATAVAQKKQLLSENPATALPFRFCTTCNVCDLVCPQQAAPYELILECYDRQAEKRGLPYIAKMVLPHEPENIWSALRPLMGERERELLRQWEENLGRQHEAIILTGFYTNLVPFLADMSIIHDLDLPIAGSEGLWGCGGDTNKMGNIGLTEQVIALIKKTFQDMGLVKIYCFMQAEAAMLSEVLPRYYQADFAFEALPLDNLILDRIRSGQLRLDHPLGLKVTVHDNCMSRCLDGNPQKVTRDILDRAGCSLVEMKHHCDNALCCGWAATIPTLYAEKSGNPLKTVAYLLFSLKRRLKEAEDTGADALVTGCPACFIFLTLIKIITRSRIEVYHLLEIVEMARGGKPLRKTEERCWEILAHTSTMILNWAISRENRRHFPLRPIDTTAIQPLAAQSPADTIRTRWFAALYKSRLTQNTITRRLLAMAVNTTARACHVWLDRQKARCQPL